MIIGWSQLNNFSSPVCSLWGRLWPQIFDGCTAAARLAVRQAAGEQSALAGAYLAARRERRPAPLSDALWSFSSKLNAFTGGVPSSWAGSTRASVALEHKAADARPVDQACHRCATRVPCKPRCSPSSRACCNETSLQAEQPQLFRVLLHHGSRRAPDAQEMGANRSAVLGAPGGRLRVSSLLGPAASADERGGALLAVGRLGAARCGEPPGFGVAEGAL